MSPKVNLDLKDAVSLKPIDEGKYPARVKDVGAVEKGPKSNYVPTKCEISEGEHEGRVFTVNLPINGKGAGIFVDFWNKAMGTDYDVDELDDLALDTDDLVGAEIGLIIENEEYPEGSGDLRSNVAKTYAIEKAKRR